MNKKIFLVCLVVALTLLSGCSTSSKLAVRPETMSKINTVALIKVSEPEAYVASNVGSPGMMLGGIGGAIAGISSANAGKSLQQITQESGFRAGEQFTRSMQEQLTKAGYKVTLITVPRQKLGKLHKSYEKIDAGGADAIMDIAIEKIGYATEHPMFSPHWRPASTVHITLVDSLTHKKLYSEKFMYGYHNPFMSGTDINAPKTYHFKDKNSLFSNNDKLVAGMEHSVTAVTHNVSRKLSK